MAQPASSVGKYQTDLIGVPAFWPKPTTEPSFTWESWIGEFFLAVNLIEHCNANILLCEPTEVFDYPPPRPERKGESETQIEEANRIASDQAEIRKTNETNEERKKKRPKIGPIVFSTKRIKESNHDYSSPWVQKVIKDSYKATATQTSQLSVSATFIIIAGPFFKRDKN